VPSLTSCSFAEGSMVGSTDSTLAMWYPKVRGRALVFERLDDIGMTTR